MNIGERVGDYEIVQILGAGGMGQVYKVRNVISNRIEAMKVLLPNLGGDAGLSERFLREIQVQATLDHPNIARLHTAQMAGDQIVMILEYVEGSTIETLMEQGSLGFRETIGYIRQVLDALEYAHERGVIHRDIKPANIMRTPKGSIKLMDFGIARMQQDRRLTQTGSTVGSLFYMSPEQIKGGQPDPRSDLYSLGVTMYEMVTGRRPFNGTSDYSVMAAHLQQAPVAPIEVVPGVPPEVNDIILMAIAKDPAQRFQSAQEFRSALEAVGTAPVGMGAGAVTHTAVVPSMPPPIPQAPVFAPPPPPPPPAAYSPAPYGMQPPVPPPPQASSSRRGLYMTLGSIATVGVIALAIFAVPRFLGTGAANLPPAPTSKEPAQVVKEPAPAPPPQNPAPATPEPQAQPAVAIPEKVPPVQQPRNPPAVVQQAPAPRSAPPPSVQQAVPQVVQQQAAPTVQQAPPAVVQQAPPAPQAPTQQAPPQQAPPVAQQAPPVRQAPAPSPELNDLRQDYNLLSVRAAAAKGGLRNFEQQQRRQGLNLRGDITEAEARMDYLLKESMDSIRAGDAASGRRSLQMAERALETLEKFLGR